MSAVPCLIPQSKVVVCQLWIRSHLGFKVLSPIRQPFGGWEREPTIQFDLQQRFRTSTAVSLVADQIENASWVIDHRPAATQKIKPDKALDFRHFRNILAGDGDVLRTGAPDPDLGYEHRRNMDGAVGGNQRDFPTSRIQVIPQIPRQPGRDRAIFRTRVEKRGRILNGFFACENTGQDNGPGSGKRIFQMKKPTPRGTTGPLNVM